MSEQNGQHELLETLLRHCIDQHASDLHLSTGLPPYYRIHGVLAPVEADPAISSEQMQSLADRVIGVLNRNSLETTGSIDGAISALGSRFRFNVYRRQGSLSIAFRKLEDRLRPLSELGLPDSLYELCELSDGLILVAGPTGSGKSTTLAALLDRINRLRRCHIITIEDPIEYLHRPQMSLVNQRQIGLDASDFNEAMVASLRQDPDVILVGEIREIHTIRTAITASETGHLVFSTVHAGDCVGAVERLISVFPADEQHGIRRQLSMVLRAIVAQHLVIADGEQRLAEAGARRSRVLASEILRTTPAVANLVAQGKSSQIYSAMESGAQQGMQTLEQDLARLWVEDVISETTAVGMARNPDVVRDRAKMVRRPSAVPATARVAGGRR